MHSVDFFVWRKPLLICLAIIFAITLLLPPLTFYFDNTHSIVIKETIWQCSTVILVLLTPCAWLIQPDKTKSDPIIIFSYILLGIILIFISLSYILLSPYPQSKNELYLWFTYILFTFVIWQWCKVSFLKDTFIVVSVVGVTLVSVYAIIQALGLDYFEWDPFGFGDDTRRVTSSMGNPDFLAGYLIGLIPFIAILCIISNGYKRWSYFIALICSGFALLFSYSRGGFVAILFAMILFLILLVYINQYKKPLLIQPIYTPKRALVAGSIFAVIALISSIMFHNELSAATGRLTQLLQGDSVSNRVYFYIASIKMWQASPLVGFGIGSYNRVFPDFRDPELSKTMPFKDWNLDHAHNEFLEIATELGLVGLILYIAFISIILHALWRTMIINRTRQNLILIGLICGIAAIWIHNMFTVTLRHTPSAFLFWGLLGLSLALIEIQKPNNHRMVCWRLNNHFLPILALMVALIISPFLLTYSIKHYRGDLLIANAFKQFDTINKTSSKSQFQTVMEDVLIKLNKGKRLAPDLFEAYYRLGLAYDLCQDFPQQQTIYLEIAELQPNFTSLAMNLFVSNLKQSDQLNNFLNQAGQSYFYKISQEKIKEAIEWIQLAIQQDPYAPEYYRMLARGYLALNETQLARDAYQKVLDTAQFRFPNQIQEVVNEAKHYLDILPSE